MNALTRAPPQQGKQLREEAFNQNVGIVVDSKAEMDSMKRHVVTVDRLSYPQNLLTGNLPTLLTNEGVDAIYLLYKHWSTKQQGRIGRSSV